MQNKKIKNIYKNIFESKEKKTSKIKEFIEVIEKSSLSDRSLIVSFFDLFEDIIEIKSEKEISIVNFICLIELFCQIDNDSNNLNKSKRAVGTNSLPINLIKSKKNIGKKQIAASFNLRNHFKFLFEEKIYSSYKNTDRNISVRLAEFIRSIFYNLSKSSSNIEKSTDVSGNTTFFQYTLNNTNILSMNMVYINNNPSEGFEKITIEINDTEFFSSVLLKSENFMKSLGKLFEDIIVYYIFTKKEKGNFLPNICITKKRVFYFLKMSEKSYIANEFFNSMLDNQESISSINIDVEYKNDIEKYSNLNLTNLENIYKGLSSLVGEENFVEILDANSLIKTNSTFDFIVKGNSFSALTDLKVSHISNENSFLSNKFSNSILKFLIEVCNLRQQINCISLTKISYEINSDYSPVITSWQIRKENMESILSSNIEGQRNLKLQDYETYDSSTNFKSIKIDDAIDVKNSELTKNIINSCINNNFLSFGFRKGIESFDLESIGSRNLMKKIDIKYRDEKVDKSKSKKPSAVSIVESIKLILSSDFFPIEKKVNVMSEVLLFDRYYEDFEEAYIESNYYFNDSKRNISFLNRKLDIISVANFNFPEDEEVESKIKTSIEKIKSFKASKRLGQKECLFLLEDFYEAFSYLADYFVIKDYD